MRQSRSALTWSILLLLRIRQLFSIHSWLYNLLNNGMKPSCDTTTLEHLHKQILPGLVRKEPSGALQRSPHTAGTEMHLHRRSPTLRPWLSPLHLNHRIPDWFVLEGALKLHPAPTPCPEQGHLPLSRLLAQSNFESYLLNTLLN